MDGIGTPGTGSCSPRSLSACGDRSARSHVSLGISGLWMSGLWISGKTWIVRRMAALAAGLSRAALNRRVVGQLSRMSDRDLKDIGLVRQDVRDSELLLLEGDASNFLIGRREERRAGRGPTVRGHETA